MKLNNISEPIFGNWYIDEEIGSGSFGTVYKIKREDFGRAYYSALKVINIPQSQSELRSIRNEFENDKSLSDYYSNFVQDFAREIEVMSELKGNSNIVSFEDHAFIRNDDGISWTILIRMELLTPFVEYQSENKIDNQAVVKLGVDICSALELCEKRNIIHRDIKPDNIFLSKDGDYELGDFGIARELEKTTGGLSKKGTYSYMAPEVYLGKPYNNTVDIYSLGIVMYKLLNRNRAPFMPEYPNPITFTDRENALQKRMKGEEIPDIKDIPKALNDIVKKACAFDPKERYKSASELKQALIEVVEADAPTVNGDKAEPEVIEATDGFDGKTEATVGPFTTPEIKAEPKTKFEKTVVNSFDEKTLGPFDEDISSNSSQSSDHSNNKSDDISGKISTKIKALRILSVIAVATIIYFIFDFFFMHLFPSLIPMRPTFSLLISIPFLLFSFYTTYYSFKKSEKNIKIINVIMLVYKVIGIISVAVLIILFGIRTYNMNINNPSGNLDLSSITISVGNNAEGTSASITFSPTDNIETIMNNNPDLEFTIFEVEAIGVEREALYYNYDNPDSEVFEQEFSGKFRFLLDVKAYGNEYSFTEFLCSGENTTPNKSHLSSVSSVVGLINNVELYDKSAREIVELWGAPDKVIVQSGGLFKELYYKKDNCELILHINILGHIDRCSLELQ